MKQRIIVHLNHPKNDIQFRPRALIRNHAQPPEYVPTRREANEFSTKYMLLQSLPLGLDDCGRSWQEPVPVSETVSAALLHSDWRIRSAGVMMLRTYWNAPKIAYLLMRAACDPHYGVRRAARQTLLSMGPDVFYELAELAARKEKAVSEKAATALLLAGSAAIPAVDWAAEAGKLDAAIAEAIKNKIMAGNK